MGFPRCLLITATGLLLLVMLTSAAPAALAAPPKYESAAVSWYLAEGCTEGGMETWVLVMNTEATPVKVDLTFMTGSGEVPGPQGVPIAANSRISLNLGSYVIDWNVSTQVTPNGGMVICERAMYGNGRTWAHDSIGVTGPSDNWNMPEGCTEGGMETFILVSNPTAVATTVDVIFMTGSGVILGPQGFPIPARSRHTFNVGDYVTDWNVSTQVNAAAAPVICERSMYGNGRTWAHGSVGAKASALTWYLAEGCTEGGMETWVLVQNPQATQVLVDVDFMTSTGVVHGPQGFVIPATSRHSFNASDYVTDWNVSTKVTSIAGNVVCERAMYGNGRAWAHDCIGVAGTAAGWYLAEGCTGPGFETWVLVQNPNASEAIVSLTFMTTNGEVPGPQGFVIPANSRQTFNAGDYVTDWNVSTMVTSDRPVICERAVYNSERTWAHDCVGYPFSF